MCWKDIVLLAADDTHGQLTDHQSLVTLTSSLKYSSLACCGCQHVWCNLTLEWLPCCNDLEWLIQLVEGVGLYRGGVHASGCLKSEIAGHDQLSLGILVQLLQVWTSGYASLNYLHLWGELRHGRR